MTFKSRPCLKGKDHNALLVVSRSYLLACHEIMSGVIIIIPKLSVYVKNLNLTYNFLKIKDRAFIFCMRIHCDKAFHAILYSLM